jgi:hypothetical protein
MCHFSASDVYWDAIRMAMARTTKNIGFFNASIIISSISQLVLVAHFVKSENSIFLTINKAINATQKYTTGINLKKYSCIVSIVCSCEFSKYP